MGGKLREDQSNNGSKGGNNFLRSLENKTLSRVWIPILTSVQWNVVLSKVFVFPVARELDLATTRGWGVGNVRKIKYTWQRKKRSLPLWIPHVFPDILAIQFNCVINFLGSLQIVLMMPSLMQSCLHKMFMDLKSSQLYEIRPVLNYPDHICSITL